MPVTPLRQNSARLPLEGGKSWLMLKLNCNAINMVSGQVWF